MVLLNKSITPIGNKPPISNQYPNGDEDDQNILRIVVCVRERVCTLIHEVNAEMVERILNLTCLLVVPVTIPLETSLPTDAIVVLS